MLGQANTYVFRLQNNKKKVLNFRESRMTLPGGSNPADVLFKLAKGRGLASPTFEQVTLSNTLMIDQVL